MRRMLMLPVHIAYTHCSRTARWSPGRDGSRAQALAAETVTHLYGKLFLMLLMRQSVVSFSLFAQAATHLNARAATPWQDVQCVCVCAAVEL